MGKIDEVAHFSVKCEEMFDSDVTSTTPDQIDNKENSSGKRCCSPDVEPVVKRLKLKKNGASNSRCQTPLALLNELRSGLSFKVVLSDGPAHSPNFLASVEVDGIMFSGSGNAKKLAKQRAAEAALLTLCPSLLTTSGDDDNNNDNNQSHCTQDSPRSLHDTPSRKRPNKQESVCNEESSRQKKEQVRVLVNKAMSGALNPVTVLNEVMPDIKYDCLQENSQNSHAPFVFGITLDGQLFKGSGSSKKLARVGAARAVLLHKFGELILDQGPLSPLSSDESQPPRLPNRSVAAANIAELVVNEYTNLMSNNKDYFRRKVLAGIVMTSTPDCSGGQLISLGTGTKCISGDHISVKGAVLNDSHAEIISRRGLLRYIYAQLSLHADPERVKESIFIYNPETKYFRLKPDIRFHLYISTSPCGDARIFSPHDQTSSTEENLDRHPNRQSRGQLRTKIESGEGTIPVKSFESIQTWDGVLQGERLRTMSCSDKVGKWNVVGLQGSLLSHFLDPIYLHSIVIGSLFNPSHLRRAFYARIENTLEDLPPPFSLNKVQMHTTTSPESRHIGKAPNHSVNWIIGEEGVEVVNAITGKTVTGASSRLCKQRLFEKFFSLLVEGIATKTGLSMNNVPDFYVDAKNSAKDYKDAKGRLMTAFAKAGLGSWMKKPLEQDHFALDTFPAN